MSHGVDFPHHRSRSRCWHSLFASRVGYAAARLEQRAQERRRDRQEGPPLQSGAATCARILARATVHAVGRVDGHNLARIHCECRRARRPDDPGDRRSIVNATCTPTGNLNLTATTVVNNAMAHVGSVTRGARHLRRQHDLDRPTVPHDPHGGRLPQAPTVCESGRAASARSRWKTDVVPTSRRRQGHPLRLAQLLHHPRRRAEGDAERRQVLRDDAVGADHAALADGDAARDHDVGAAPDVVAYPRGPLEVNPCQGTGVSGSS